MMGMMLIDLCTKLLCFLYVAAVVVAAVAREGKVGGGSIAEEELMYVEMIGWMGVSTVAGMVSLFLSITMIIDGHQLKACQTRNVASCDPVITLPLSQSTSTHVTPSSWAPGTTTTSFKPPPPPPPPLYNRRLASPPPAATILPSPFTSKHLKSVVVVVEVTQLPSTLKRERVPSTEHV